MRCRRHLLVALALTTLLTVAAPASPSSAHQWTEPNVWAANHTIGSGLSVNQGNVVKLWQSFIHNRFGGWCAAGSTCPNTINGYFNATTHNHTMLWQAQHTLFGLAIDGIVGPNTWNVARWFYVTAWGSSGGWDYYRYTD